MGFWDTATDILGYGVGAPVATAVANAAGWESAGEVFEPYAYAQDRKERIESETAVNRARAQGPSQLAAELLRQQFAEWRKTFKPIEVSSMNEISFNNPSVVTDAVDKARGAATTASDKMRGIIYRKNASQGIAVTPQQDNVSNRILDLDKAASIAGAENTARANVRAIDEQILLGSAPNPNITKATGV